jgi:hypothetical protein
VAQVATTSRSVPNWVAAGVAEFSLRRIDPWKLRDDPAVGAVTLAGALAQSLTHCLVTGVEGTPDVMYVDEETKLAQHHMGRFESMAGFNEAHSAFVLQLVLAVAVTPA